VSNTTRTFSLRKPNVSHWTVQTAGGIHANGKRHIRLVATKNCSESLLCSPLHTTLPFGGFLRVQGCTSHGHRNPRQKLRLRSTVSLATTGPLLLDRLGQKFVGETPGYRRAILGFSPRNDRPRWYNHWQGYDLLWHPLAMAASQKLCIDT
jgi:hypothetical protein